MITVVGNGMLYLDWTYVTARIILYHLRIMLYFARAFAPQTSRVWFSVTHEFCLAVHNLPNQIIIYHLTTSSSSSIINCHPYLVSMRATAENPLSYKYIAREEISFNCTPWEPFSQSAKTEEAILHETCLSRTYPWTAPVRKSVLTRFCLRQMGL